MSKALIEKYLNSVTEFLTIAKSFPGPDLGKAPKQGGWSGAFVAHHMADSETFFSTRYFFALTEEKPTISTFDEEIFPSRLQYAQRNVEVSLDAVKSISSLISNVLSNIPDGDWNRISIHPDAGEMTISMILEKVSSHYQAHIGQLKEIKAGL